MKRILAIALLAALGQQALAGDWTVKLGAHVVDPKSDNGTLAGTLPIDVDSNTRPSLMVEYLWTPNWGVEVLAAVPFEHEIRTGGAKIGEITHLPPTVTLQYHFNPEGSVSPYIGAGLNYTFIYDEEAKGPIAGSRLRLDDSFGLAAHAGIDFKLNERWSLGADIRWIDLNTDVTLDGADIGEAEVDPLAYGAYLLYRF
ncbi:MAG: OmpW family protein [Xanthomonadales bacterium]|nr:OmpW family protein [Xanthomonadales bacterium]